MSAGVTSNVAAGCAGTAMRPPRVLTAFTLSAAAVLLTSAWPFTASKDVTGSRNRAQRESRVIQCTATISRTASAGSLRTCATSPITLGVQTLCTPRPLHIVLMLSGTTPLARSEWRQYTEAVLHGLSMGQHANVKAGVVWVNADSAMIKQRLSSREADLRSAL